jgi:hypothetical protein
MTITKKIVLDAEGNPSDVMIPYEQFIELSETYGWDLDDQEQKELASALEDSRAENRDAFVPASEV